MSSASLYPVPPRDAAVWLAGYSSGDAESLGRCIDGRPGLYCACVCASTEDALEALDTAFAPAAILVAPGRAAAATAVRAIHARAMGTHVLVRTDIAALDGAFEALCAGAAGFVLEGTVETQVVDLLETVLRGGAPMDGPTAHRILDAFAERFTEAGHHRLSEVEADLLRRFGEGLNTAQVAATVHQSPVTIETYVRGIYAKLHANAARDVSPPGARAVAPLPPASAAEAPVAQVWVVEDNPAYQEKMRGLLDGRAGLQCTHTFARGEEVLHALDTELLPDVILMDIRIPGEMDGIACVEKIRERLMGLPILMLTNYSEMDTIFRAICAGASGYLLKAETDEQILEAIEEALQGRAPIDGRIARRVLEMFKQEFQASYDFRLSDREQEVLELLCEGLSKQQIADELFLAVHTVDSHVRSIYRKLEVNTNVAAAVKYVGAGGRRSRFLRR